MAADGIRALFFLVQCVLCHTKHVPLCYEFAGRSGRRFSVDFRARRCTLALYESLKMLTCEVSIYKAFDVVKAACFARFNQFSHYRRQNHD